MRRWPLLLLMCLPGLALVAAWGAGRWTVAGWDADLPMLEVPPVEGEGGFADLRYAWADGTPDARAGRLAGTVRRDARAGYASDEDWAGDDVGEPWDEAREQAREACFALEDEIAAADCLGALDAGEGAASDGGAPAGSGRSRDDGRPVGTVFGPKPDGRQPGAGVPEVAAPPAPPAGRAEKGAPATADGVDLRPAPDDAPTPAEACPLAEWGVARPDCLATLEPEAARAWLDGHAQALAAVRRGLAAPHRRDPRPHGGRQPAWPELGRLARTAAALRFLDGDQAGGLAEACTLSLQWRGQLLDPGVDRGRLDGLREDAEAARLALGMRLAAPSLAPPAHCGAVFALAAAADAGPGPACLVMRGIAREHLDERAFTPEQREDPDRRRFAARLVRPYCGEGSRFEAEVLAGAPPEALEPDTGIGLLAMIGAPALAFEAAGMPQRRQVLRALLDAQAQRRALHAAWATLDAAAAGGAPPADAATALAARDPGAGGAQALGLAKSGQWIEVPLWGPAPVDGTPRGVYRLPLAARIHPMRTSPG